MAVKPKAKPAAKPAPRKRGPRLKLDPDSEVGQLRREAILNFAAKGCTNAMICDCLEINKQTLYTELKRDPQFSTDLSNARSGAKEFVMGALLKNISGGDTKAAIYWLERIGRVIKDEHGHEPVTIIFKRGGAAVSDGD